MRNFQHPNRSAAYGERCAIATSHPVAAQVGFDVLRDGGSAADAAIAASLVLAVAEPQNAGLGGDTFWMHATAGGEVSAYNGSGRTPAALDAAAIGTITQDSPHSVTVPGAVDALLALHAQHGRLELPRLFAPAIRLAAEGCLIQPRVAWDWQFSAQRLSASPTAAPLFGRSPQAGERLVQPALAHTLTLIRDGGREAFYAGAPAASITRTLRALGGYHHEEDFARHRGEAVTPIRGHYRGWDILECPPNGQGMTVLMMLNLLSGLDMPAIWQDPVAIAHTLAQVSGLAYAERNRWVTDPDFSATPLERLLSPVYADQLRATLRPDRAPEPRHLAEPEHKDTVYLSCVDRDGNTISFINSIFTDFGSAIVDADTGLLLHNRAATFASEPGHPNAAAPNKRPMHTIIPGLALRDGLPVASFGVMGGHYQATGQVQVLSAMLDAGLDPQQAVELPRHFWYDGVLELETTVPESVVQALIALGYPTRRAARPIGGGQIIRIDRARGLLIAGTDPRKDGLALAG